MKAKKIKNIVFYKVVENDKEIKKACIFYFGGEVLDTTYEEGINACEQIVKERNIVSTNVFKEMINKELVHVVTAEDFKANFEKYVSRDIIDQELIDEAIEESFQKINTPTISPAKKEEEIAKTITPVVVPIVNKEEVTTAENTEAKENATDIEESKKEESTTPVVAPVVVPVTVSTPSKKEEKEEEKSTNEETVVPVVTPVIETETDSKEEQEEVNENLESEVMEEEITEPTKEEKEGFFKRIWRKFKESKLGVKITAIGLAVLIGLGLYSCSNKQTKEGRMLNSNITTSQLYNPQNATVVTPAPTATPKVAPTPTVVPTTAPTVIPTPAQTAVVETPSLGQNTIYDAATNSVLVIGDNSYYYGYTFDQLLAVTTNESQKRAMTNLYKALTGYNDTFADAYVEEGKDIRAALSFDEIVALQQAYNDYSKEEIRAYFNGAEVNSGKMTADYKIATLQLMGAHVIENSEHPVDMSMLLETQEGRDFYNRYHAMFLAAKEATGEEKLRLVEEFYRAVRSDFPITPEERTEGISHADTYASLDSYKLSVVPMIAASEMLFQNLDVDYTLNDCEIDFFNDIGLCNVANDKFDRIEAITLACCQDDKTNPLYEQYRDEMIRELEARGHYVIDDEHRELSKLDSFQENLYGEGSWSFVGSVITTTETHTETVTWTETTTETHEETEVIEAEIPEDEKQKIDEELEKENEEARRKAEEEAAKEAERLQEEADKEAERIEQEIAEEEEDLQEKIEDANEQIDLNQDDDPTNDKPVNEEDFGDHHVDFYDEYEDGQGNLDDSVEDITTDPTGDQTGEPLPDPEETGRAFDEEFTEVEFQTEIEVNNSDNSVQARQVEATPVEVNEVQTVEETTVVEAPVAEEVQVVEQAPVVEAPVVEEVQVVEQAPVVEYEEPYVVQIDESASIEFPAGFTPITTYEEAVNDYVESLANEPAEEETFELSK